MNALNSIILEGSVVRKPEIRKTPKGTDVCTLLIGVNRWFKSMDGQVQREVSFFDVDAWGALAQSCSEKCDKGRGVRIVGRLRQNRWMDREGKSKSQVVIVAEHVEFRSERDCKKDEEFPELSQEKHRENNGALCDLADANAAQALLEQEVVT